MSAVPHRLKNDPIFIALIAHRHGLLVFELDSWASAKRTEIRRLRTMKDFFCEGFNTPD